MTKPRAVLFVAVAVACSPIVGEPVSDAPKNACDVSPCERYQQQSRATPTCTTAGRCEVAGKPDYLYVLAISVPESSFFAPGRSFLLRSQDFRGDGTRCPSATCIALPPIIEVSGEYMVTSLAAQQLGYPMRSEYLPARVAYFPEIVLEDGTRREASEVGLPSNPTFATLLAATSSLPTRFLSFVPSGPFQRVALPAPPFDDAFPPTTDSLNVIPEGAREDIIPYFTDRFVVGRSPPLDDPTGESHTAVVKRRAGLDGFYTYLRDRRSERRISSFRALSGTEASVRLDTVGENTPGGALRDGIDIVVMPDERWVGVPTLRDRILAGVGFRLDYPDLPPPIGIAGTVVGDSPVAAQVTFVSTGIEVKGGAPSLQLLYRATVRTDANGRFSTVLPPGTYDAFVEPEDDARAFGKTRVSITVSSTVSSTRKDFLLRAPRKGVVSGKVRISDGRALANAEVLWAPSSVRRASPSPWESPRPGRANTDGDGRFSVALDEGEYDLTVVPEPQTGFPRFVAPRRPVGPNDVSLEDLVVFAPSRVSFTIKPPGGPAKVARAVVRAFAYVSAASGYVEIGQSLTDAEGQFELLLGPLPK